jgi:hypothetical protein
LYFRKYRLLAPELPLAGKISTKSGQLHLPPCSRFPHRAAHHRAAHARSSTRVVAAHATSAHLHASRRPRFWLAQAAAAPLDPLSTRSSSSRCRLARCTHPTPPRVHAPLAGPPRTTTPHLQLHAQALPPSPLAANRPTRLRSTRSNRPPCSPPARSPNSTHRPPAPRASRPPGQPTLHTLRSAKSCACESLLLTHVSSQFRTIQFPSAHQFPSDSTQENFSSQKSAQKKKILTGSSGQTHRYFRPCGTSALVPPLFRNPWLYAVYFRKLAGSRPEVPPRAVLTQISSSFDPSFCPKF